MKKINTLVLFCLAAGLACTLTGCGTASGLFTAQPVVSPAATNLVAVVSPPVTNADGSVTPAVTNQVAVVTPASTNETYTVNPKVLDAGQKIAPMLPAPAGGLAEAGLGLLAGVLGLMAKWKSNQLSKSQKLNAVLQPVIAGVEAAASPEVKAAIQSHAVAAGVQQILDPLVQSVAAQIPSKAKAATPPAL